MPIANKPLSFVDSHCHFDFSEFDDCHQRIWQECQKRGIKQLLIPGVEPGQWKKVSQMTGPFTGIYFAVGIHPWWIGKCLLQDGEAFYKNSESQLKKYLQQENCVAVGECGLDKMVETDFSLQENVLQWHLQLASDLNLPVIIHCRKAHNEVLQQLKNFNNLRGVIHAFSGSAELAEQYWTHGFYVGIGGTITYERAKKTRETVKQIPLEWMLLETDAPDMPLSGMQGQPNSPVNVFRVAQCLAELRSGGAPADRVQGDCSQGVMLTNEEYFEKEANKEKLRSEQAGNRQYEGTQKDTALTEISIQTTNNFNTLFLSS